MVDFNTEFVKMFGQYHSRLLKLATRYVRDSIAAEDIISDSYVAFLNAAKDIPQDGKIGYLFTIVKNNCLNYLYAQRNHLRINKNIHADHLRLIEANIESLESCNPSGILSSEVQNIIMATLSKLPELDRQVFEKSRFDGKTYAEIAQDCNISVRHVTSIIQRVLAVLRKELRDYI